MGSKALQTVAQRLPVHIRTIRKSGRHIIKSIVECDFALRLLAGFASAVFVVSATSAQDQTQQWLCEQKCLDANDATILQCRADEEKQLQAQDPQGSGAPEASGKRRPEKAPGGYITEEDAYNDTCPGSQGQAVLSQCLDTCEAG